MTRAATRWVGWLLLVVHALTGMTSGRGLVLCFEPDGHVSLESVDDCGSCCTSEGAKDGARVSNCACSDVSVSVAETGQVKLVPVSVDAPPRSVRIAPPLAAHSTFVASRALPRSHASSALDALRCVVLLV